MSCESNGTPGDTGAERPVRAAEAIAELLPSDVAIETAVPGEGLGTLHPEEAKLVERVAEVRRNEFSTGRWLARRGLARLGLPTGPLLPGERREPLWPDGAVGSISHTRELCGVVVAREGDLIGLGLDLEGSEGLASELSERILTPREREWIDAQHAGSYERARIAKLVFSAKECFYKCQYPQTRQFLGFHDVELDLDLERRRFRARPMVELGPAMQLVFEGGFVWEADHVITAMAIARSRS